MRPRHRLLGLLLVGLLAAPRPAAADPIYRGRLLVDVLEELRERGLELVFSSAVVSDEVVVTLEPQAGAPRVVLEQILEPLGLEARDGPAGSLLILPGGGTLRGRVVSASGGTPIAGASVSVRGTRAKATTGPDGAFDLRRIPAGTYSVVTEAPGFTKATVDRVRVAPRFPAELLVKLQGKSSFVTGIVVTPDEHSPSLPELTSRQTIDSDDAMLVPTVGGDISRIVGLLPAVSASDNSAAFHVRGSEAEDVSLILDGLELYEPFHLQSYQSPFSLVDRQVVDRIDFSGGGFTADLGDRHGGFVEMATDLAPDAYPAEIEVGTLNSRMSYRAPLSRISGSWLASVRSWYPEFLDGTIALGGGEEINPSFEDAYLKATFDLAPRTVLSVHGLLAYDRLEFREHGEGVNEAADALGRSGYIWLRALNAWSAGWTSETLVSGGRIERLRDGLAAPESGAVQVNDDRVVNFYGFKHDSEWQISGSHHLRAGFDVRQLEAAYRYSNQGIDDQQPATAIRLSPEGTSIGAHFAHRMRLLPRLATEVGVRWDRQTYTEDQQLSPRFNACWSAGERSELRLGLGRYFQSQRIHELRVEDGETAFSPAELSQQAELTFEHRFSEGLRLRVDGYYRKLSRLRPRYENLFEPIELFPETEQDRVRLAPERAELRGAEILLGGAPNRPLTWWVSYARSWAEDVIDGEQVPRSWDQPHAAKFLAGYRFDERWWLSLSGIAHSGWPTTPVSAVIATLPDGSSEIEAVPGRRNSERFSRYLRLDAKASRSFSLEGSRLHLTLEVVNLTQRQNPCCVDEFHFEPQADGSVDVRPEFDFWQGATPSFHVLWEF